MLDPHALFDARPIGRLRHVLLSTPEESIDRVLALCGLRPDAAALTEVDRTTAMAQLTTWLYQDLAYGSPCMERDRAAAWASAILDDGTDAQSRFYSSDSGISSSEATRRWTSLTDATFDAGLLIRLKPGRWACWWIEDED